MASAATALLIGKITSILENEASSIARVRDEVDEIKLELEIMKCFLEDAEGKKAATQVEKRWIASVRNLAYDVEDIMDEFMYHMYEQQSGGRFARFLQKTIHIPKNLWYESRIAKKLQKIIRTIKTIPERNQRYGVIGLEGTASDDSHTWVKNKAESSLFIKEDELVGIEGKKQMLMGWLMNGEKRQTSVVSVVGMGGSGKTTLVAKTFTQETVKRHFNCYAWITVSQTYVIEDLFRSLIYEFHQSKKQEVPGNLQAMSYKELLEMLANYLVSKRYLVVLDDVWDFTLWENIRLSFPDEQNGSRIMLTTRREDIASYSFGVESHVYPIQLLNSDEAKELFSKRAFPTYHNICPLELENLAWELVDKCNGLPLAIVALSGLMSSKKSSAEWRKVYNSLNWHLSNNPLLDSMKNILLLSFNGLSYRLKHCFLYCSLFPEDYLMGKNRLIKLWIAEGFIEHVKGVTPEAVAESYLMELIFRSMLQVATRNETGRPRTCKMHDLMRELAQSKSESENFAVVYDGKEVMKEIGARRMSILATDREIKPLTGMSQLRSFLVFSSSCSEILPSGLKLLRVLDLERSLITKLSDDVVYLFNLRYLNLRKTAIKELPKSIGRLHNLQSLDLRDSNIKAIPRGISKLLNLRHLIMFHYTGVHMGFRYIEGTKGPSGICKLKNLQVLACVESEGNIIRLVGNMTQLTRLGITNVKERDEIDLCDSIQKMQLLYDLFLMVTDEEECLRLNALSSPPAHLQKLVLAGKLEMVPRWFSSLHSLTNLNLHWSRLEEDLLPHIEALTSLRSLTLYNAYTGKNLCFSTGFTNLVHLRLCNFPLLNKITIEKGMMPNLQVLMLDSCMEVKTLPGIEHLSNLETLQLGSVSMQLIESIREAGVDHSKVHHLPDVDDLVRTIFGRFHA